MRFNFYISCENDQEARDCIDFISEMTAKRGAVNAADSWPAAEPATPTKSDVRPNVDPGKPSITKIGGSTRDEILTRLRDGLQPAAKFTEHCKLLWSRGEIKFDGESWYA